LDVLDVFDVLDVLDALDVFGNFSGIFLGGDFFLTTGFVSFLFGFFTTYLKELFLFTAYL